MTDSPSPLRQLLPVPVTTESAGTPVQQAFRQAIGAVEELREQLRAVLAAQTAARQAYWQQVGPLAAATVAARRALYLPLEEALTAGYLNRAEAAQVTEAILHNARSLQERFGEDEAAVLARYAPVAAQPAAPIPGTGPVLPPHEQAAAAARARRQARIQQARQAAAQAADTAGQALLQNTKAAYRQLARLHHPDRAAHTDTNVQQAQTALMQQITAAYAAGDLAALLGLLAAPGAVATPTDEAEALLRRYTEALAHQHGQLGQQLAAARQPDAHTPWSGTEKQQRTQLRQLKRELRAETDYLGYLLRQLREPLALRSLLRELSASGRKGF